MHACIAYGWCQLSQRSSTCTRKAAALYQYAVLLPLFRCFIVVAVCSPSPFPFFVVSFLDATLLPFFFVKRALFSFFTYSFTSLFVVSFVRSFIWLDRFVWLKSSWVIHFHLDTFSEYREMYLYLCEGFLSLSPLSLFLCVFVFQKMCTLFAYNVV